MQNLPVSTRRALLIFAALVIVLMAIAFWLFEGIQFGNGGHINGDRVFATDATDATDLPSLTNQPVTDAEILSPDAAEDCVEEESLTLAELMKIVYDEGLVEEFERRKAGLVERLAVSPEAEHLHVAALQKQDTDSRLQLMQRALDIDPDSAAALWTAANMCAAPLATIACPLEDWVNRLVQIDSHNSEAWMLAATTRYESDDIDGALAAMRQAAVAPETRIFWPDLLEISERSLAAGGDFSFAERVSTAFDTVATITPNYRLYTKMCREQSAHNAEWAALCLAYGKRTELQGKTTLGVAISRRIQSIALEEMGDAAGHAAIQARIKDTRAQRLAEAKSGKHSLMNFALFSPVLFDAYVKAMRTVGEDEAVAYVTKEARRLMSEEPANGCENGV